MEQKYLVRIKSDVREAEFDVTGENGVYVWWSVWKKKEWG